MAAAAFGVGASGMHRWMLGRVPNRVGVEAEVSPQRCPDEANVLDVHSSGVKQCHAVVAALSRELESYGVEFGAVELVVAWDVEEVGPVPGAQDLSEALGTHWGQVASQDHDVGVGGDRGQAVRREFDVEVAEYLDSHRVSGSGRGLYPRRSVSAICTRRPSESRLRQ